MRNRTTFVIVIAVLVLVLASPAHANMILPAYFIYVPVMFSVAGVAAVLLIEFVLLRAFVYGSTIESLIADLTMNGVSTLAGIVLVPIGGMIIGLLSWQHGLGDLGANLIAFTFIVLVNVIVEGAVLSRTIGTALGVRGYLTLTAANTLSNAALAFMLATQSKGRL